MQQGIIGVFTTIAFENLPNMTQGKADIMQLKGNQSEIFWYNISTQQVDKSCPFFDILICKSTNWHLVFVVL